MSLAGTLTAIIDLQHKSENAVITSPTEKVIAGTSYLSWALTDGVGANEADLVYSAQRTLGAGVSEEIDLYGGLDDSFGNTLNFARIKGFYIKPKADNGDTITVGNASANGWPGFFGALTHTIVLPAGSVIMILAPDATGWPVTNASADKLKVVNNDGGAAAIYDIVLIGASA